MKTASFELHSHTTVSDGELTPAQLLQKAAAYGIGTLAITDHDSVGAYTDATYEHADNLGIELLPGIEISTRDENAYRFHILGLGIGTRNHHLLKAIERMRQSRAEYTQASCAALNELGFSVDAAQLLASGSTVTKAHIADAVIDNPANKNLLKHYFRGHLPNRGAFIEQMMINGAANVPRAGHMTPEAAIDLINGAGGISVLAHPMSGLFEGVPQDYLLQRIADMPVDGIEAFSIYYARSHGNRRVDMIDRFTKLANDLGKIVTAGSDYHGSKGMGGSFVDLGFRGQDRVPGRKILNGVLKLL